MTEAYAELHAHSGFSFLDGSSDPEELVAEADRLGLAALALTDHHGFYGVVRFAEAARVCGLPTVFGTEVTLAPASPRTGEADPTGTHLVVLARDPDGYARLSTVLADAHLGGGEKGRPVFTLDALARAAGGHWLVLSGCRKGAVPAALMDAGPRAASREVGRLVDAFGRAPTSRWSCGTTGTRSTRRGTTRWRISPSPGASTPWRPTTCTTRRRPGSGSPPRSPRCGHAAPWPSSRVGCRRPRRPACAPPPSSPGASPAGPAWSSAPPSSGGPVRSTCASSRRGCRTSPCPRAWTSRATCASW